MHNVSISGRRQYLCLILLKTDLYLCDLCVFPGCSAVFAGHRHDFLFTFSPAPHNLTMRHAVLTRASQNPGVTEVETVDVWENLAKAIKPILIYVDIKALDEICVVSDIWCKKCILEE